MEIGNLYYKNMIDHQIKKRHTSLFREMERSDKNTVLTRTIVGQSIAMPNGVSEV
jgi:hypothetical protein